MVTGANLLVLVYVDKMYRCKWIASNVQHDFITDDFDSVKVGLHAATH